MYTTYLLALGWQGREVPVALPCQGTHAVPYQAHQEGLLGLQWRVLVDLEAPKKKSSTVWGACNFSSCSVNLQQQQHLLNYVYL